MFDKARTPLFLASAPKVITSIGVVLKQEMLQRFMAVGWAGNQLPTNPTLVHLQLGQTTAVYALLESRDEDT